MSFSGTALFLGMSGIIVPTMCMSSLCSITSGLFLAGSSMAMPSLFPLAVACMAYVVYMEYNERNQGKINLGLPLPIYPVQN